MAQVAEPASTLPVAQEAAPAPVATEPADNPVHHPAPQPVQPSPINPASPSSWQHTPAAPPSHSAPIPETLPLAEVLAHARVEPALEPPSWPEGKTEAGSKIALEVSAAVENLAQASHNAEHPTPHEPEEAEEPSFVKSARRAQKYRGMWLLLQSISLLLLLTLLLGQAIYTWRDLIAVRWPVTRALLNQGCALLHCKIGLPTQISQLSIELGELQALKRGKQTFSYSTLIRNASPTRQSWPYIELTLQDEDGRPVAKRVFEPKSYLLPGELERGFPAQSEQAVKLYFDTTQLKAANFHATIFYP